MDLTRSSQNPGKSSLSMILYMCAVPPTFRRSIANPRNLSAIWGRFMTMRSAMGRSYISLDESPVIGTRRSMRFLSALMRAKCSASGFRSME